MNPESFGGILLDRINPDTLSSSSSSASFDELVGSSSTASSSRCESEEPSSSIASPSNKTSNALCKPSNSNLSCQVSARIPSAHSHDKSSSHRVLLYKSNADSLQHIALVFGNMIQSTSLNEWRPEDDSNSMNRAIRGALPMPLSLKSSETSGAPLVRIHSCCFTGETLGSLRCDCADQLHEAMRLMSLEGSGVILYLAQEGRGIGLADKLMAYNLIDLGYDTLSANVALGHPPDARTYDVAFTMLQDLGLSSIRLLTNNPHKVESLEKAGITVVERIPMIPRSWDSNKLESISDLREHDQQKTDSQSTTYHRDQDVYLMTKIQKMGHLLEIPSSVLDRVSSS